MRANTERLGRLREMRLAEDDRQVCMERAEIISRTQGLYGHLSRTQRQAAVVRDLCEQITPVIEPDDLLVARMPEIVPSAEEERFIEEHPELFSEAGVPGWLDSLSIFIPDWDRLVDGGLGGIAAEAQERVAAIPANGEDSESRREFMSAAVHALESVAILIRRYADAAQRAADVEECPRRRGELVEITERCARVAWGAPASFMDALQLVQIVHMVMSCLIGGRDVTPGRMDQYLWPLYRDDLGQGRLDRETAVELLAMFFLRLSQMAGGGTDFDDSVRRTPCKYTHLYVTVGGLDAAGATAINDLSLVIADAVRLLNYREPTLLVRYRPEADRAFALKVAELIRDRLPVTIYNDDIVIMALGNQGVRIEDARGYAFSACHNVLVVGSEAGSGPGGFHNVAGMLLLALNAGRDLLTGDQAGAQTPAPGDMETFEQFWEAFRVQVRFALEGVRQSWDERWRQDCRDCCPLLQSALMAFCLERQEPCWRAAPVSHYNHYLMGVGTVVDSLVAIQQLVFEGHELGLGDLLAVLVEDWSGHGALRERVRTRLPRYGQDGDETRAITARLGRMWVEEVRRAGAGMGRLQMWPGFYSHLSHVHRSKTTPATPDGRKYGQPLSENHSPSFGTPGCSPTSILRSMAALPFAETPAGAGSLTLCAADVERDEGLERLLGLLDTYFLAGGLHLQVNVLDPGVLEDAMERPESYSDLVVRVTGFSANFTRLSRDVQDDLVRRYRRDTGGGPEPARAERKTHSTTMRSSA